LVLVVVGEQHAPVTDAEAPEVRLPGEALDVGGGVTFGCSPQSRDHAFADGRVEAA